jgi:hypothetical protein
MLRTIFLLALICTLCLAHRRSCLADESLIASVTGLRDARSHRDFPAMCLDGEGTPWVTYVEHDGKSDTLWVAQHRGKKLSPVAQIAGPGIIHQPAIASDRGDGIWVFWSQVDTQRNDRVGLYARRLTNGKLNKEDKAVTIANSDRNDVFPHAASDAAGRVWVTWQSFRNGYSDIFARHVDQQSGKWSDEIQVSSHAAGDWEPRIAFGEGNAAAIVFDSSRGGVFNVYLAMVQPDGTTKRSQLSKSSRYQGRPTIAAAADGKSFWVAWENGRQRWGKDSREVGSSLGLNATKRVDVVQFVPETGKITRTPPVKPAIVGTRGKAAVVAKRGKPTKRRRRPNSGAVLNVPEIMVDAEGSPWVACRYYQKTHWQIGLSKYDVKLKKWTPAVTLPNSTFGQDRRLHALRATDGRLWLAWPSDLRTNKTALIAGVYLAQVNHAAASPASVAGIEPVVPKARSVFGDDTPERTRNDRHEWTFEGKRYKLYWGDFHRHTDVSNCRTSDDGCIVEQFRYAYDMGKLDFLGTSDHTDIAKKYDPYEWWCNQKLADVFQSPDFFTSFYVYEREQRWPWGHRNVVFGERGGPIVYINRNLYKNSPWYERLPVKDGAREISPQELWQVLRKDGRPVTVISHTGATGMGTDWDLYKQIDGAVENLVEIYQGARVSYEGIDLPQPTVGRSRAGKQTKPGTNKRGRDFGKYNKGVYQNALKNGHTLGVFASSDHISTHTSFGGVYVTEFTRQGIIEGLNARRTIAATDKIFVELSANGRMLGSKFATSDKPVMKIAVFGTAPVDRVTIVRNETNYRPFEPGTKKFSVTFTDTAPLVGENRYYLRVEQADGNMAWSTPLWITYKKP